MKTSKMFRMLWVGFFLSFFLAACAGSDTMAGDDMMKESQTTRMEMEKNDMNMQNDGMKGDTMMDKGHSDSMMKPDTMEDDKAMHELPTAMLDGSKDHHAAGKVSFSRDMGKTVLRLSDITVDKVPDGHVYLARNGNRKDGIHLGILRQFTGNVAFALPADADPAAYDSVIIYCEKYDVEIGRARFGKKM